MKKLKLILTIIISILIVLGIVLGINSSNNSKVVAELDELTIEKDKMPSVDFIQPCLLDDDFNYDTYFSELSGIGYDTIIIQMTRSEEADGTSTFYYDTAIESTTLGVKKSEYSNKVLDTLLAEAEEHDFDYYIGLSVEEYSWWALTCYYDEEYMNHCADVDCYMVKELYDLYGSNDHFVGWYFAYELFSNPIGWENLWVENVNKVIDKILEVDSLARPIIFSPFRQIQLGLITNEYLMWKNFFKKSHFRKDIDIMCPQDSIGKLDDTNDPHQACSNQAYRQVYDYINQTSKATEEAGLKFWVNCELFRAYKGDSAYLFLADSERIERQIKNAQRKADTLVTFSASHYMLTQGDQGTYDDRADLLSEYKTIRNNAK